MAFDPKTAYADDWQYLDNVATVTLYASGDTSSTETAYTGCKLSYEDIANPEFSGVVGFRDESTSGVFFKGSADPVPPDPRIKDRLIDTDDGTEYIIESVTEVRHSRWVVSLVKAKVNLEN